MIIVPSNVSASTINQFIKQLAVGVDPERAVAIPNGTRVYVSNTDSFTGSISVIDTTSDSVTATVSLLGPRGLCASPDGAKVYAASNYSGNVAVIDTASNTVVSTVTCSGNPNGLAITPDGSKIYANNFQNSVSVINTATNSIVQTIATGGTGTRICMLPNGSKAYAITADKVSVINCSTNSVVATLNFSTQSLGDICASPDSSTVCVSHISGGANTGIHVINTSSDTVTSKILHPYSSLGLAFGPDGYLYSTDSRLSVFDVSTGNLLSWNFVRVGSSGTTYSTHGLTFAPGVSKCYVLDRTFDNCFVFSLV